MIDIEHRDGALILRAPGQDEIAIPLALVAALLPLALRAIVGEDRRRVYEDGLQAGRDAARREAEAAERRRERDEAAAAAEYGLDWDGWPATLAA